MGAFTFWKQSYLFFLTISGPYIGLVYLEGEEITTSFPRKSQLEYAFTEHFSGASYSVTQIGVMKTAPALGTQIPALSFISCIVLPKTLDLSELKFHHL